MFALRLNPRLHHCRYRAKLNNTTNGVTLATDANRVDYYPISANYWNNLTAKKTSRNISIVYIITYGVNVSQRSVCFDGVFWNILSFPTLLHWLPQLSLKVKNFLPHLLNIQSHEASRLIHFLFLYCLLGANFVYRKLSPMAITLRQSTQRFKRSPLFAPSYVQLKRF